MKLDIFIYIEIQKEYVQIGRQSAGLGLYRRIDQRRLFVWNLCQASDG